LYHISHPANFKQLDTTNKSVLSALDDTNSDPISFSKAVKDLKQCEAMNLEPRAL